MDLGILILIILGISVIGFVFGRSKASRLAKHSDQKMHSLPLYHGQFVWLFAAVPALVMIALWLFIQPIVVENRAAESLSEVIAQEGVNRSLVMIDVRRVAEGLDLLQEGGDLTDEQIVELDADQVDIKARMAELGLALAGDVSPQILEASRAYRKDVNFSRNSMTLLALGLSLTLAIVAYSRIRVRSRARQASENFVIGILIGCSTVAILTTVGIVFSMLFETFNFFGKYPALEFFTSFTWNPQFRGGSTLGIIPLLWGTMYVSFIALLVAVPIGLMIAIFLAEYAGPKVRATAKPAIEILAGIPTIVYGLFALITVGPFIRDNFAEPLGLGSSASSVLTAGIVMGIMLIPFVSSLSDDVINAVPQSLRDGSYGLGSTQSETIKRVILPAALPGIVGAILLAASRAIGETMIVVLGAGAAAKMSLNPFEAMTTVTVKIVSQLTGDTAFESPETLVAFALGLTLFCFTLALNVVALYIVRKYREQYD